ncbi:two-component system response regulator DegU [Pontibacter saemangeumensis]|uniref:Two-component system response regulator DegU n=1 Tax=Pontibacter saemangeumensis TaxID=1084525 RepID=A0ABP8L8Z0_9BACT
MIKLVLTDDHKLFREGIKALLTEDETIEIAGEAGSGNELLTLLATVPADMVLLDISMPEMDGLETIKLLRQQHPSVKVMVLSMLDNEWYVQQMLEVGAAGYLLKNISKEELRAAINMVASGMQYISPNLTIDFLRKSNAPAPAFTLDQDNNKKPHKELSKREMEVLNLISEGFTNAEISERLFTSKRTIETHRQNLLEKTQTKNTAALIKFAVLNGIIS